MLVSDRQPDRDAQGQTPAGADGQVARAPSAVESGWWRAREQLAALTSALATRPLSVLALLGLASLLGYLLQGGLSERLRTTWHLANRWDFAISATMPGAWLFRAAAAWVPRRLPAPLPGAASSASAFLMDDFAFTAATALLFALYALALALRWVARHPATPATRARTLLLIGGVGAVISALLLFSPSAPSHDPIAYGSYGRLLGTYHANPFFAVPADYPRDPLLAANEWPHSATAYGPLWNVLAWLLNPLVGDDPLRSNMVYRAVEYVFHLANIGILVVALRHLPAHLQSWRERGLLLYAWNPLVIAEVAGGHNDVAMLTLLLLGLVLLARGRTYWAMGSFAGALLIKSSAWPLVLVVLLGLWLGERGAAVVGAGGWRGRLRALRPAGVVAGVALASYLPFLWGHSLSEIGAASRSQPTEQALSRHLASSFATLAGQIGSVPLLAHAVLALASPTLWTALISLALVAACFFVLPLARRVAGLPVALAWVYAVFMVFLSIFHLLRTWYVVPLVGLVALTPGGRAIRRFTLVLTATTQIENLFLSQSPPFNGWQPWTWLLVMGIPLAVLVADLRRDGFDVRAAARQSRALLLASLGRSGTAGGATYVGEGSRPANP